MKNRTIGNSKGILTSKPKHISRHCLRETAHPAKSLPRLPQLSPIRNQAMEKMEQYHYAHLTKPQPYQRQR